MFNSYEELMQAVSDRRKDQLVLEVDLGAEYSQEHEEAKKALATAKGLKSLAGEQQFINDNIASLEQRVADTKPATKPVWIRYKRLDLMEWAALMKQQGISAMDQYEKVLNKTFIGVYNGPEEDSTLLSDDPRLLSSQGDQGILPGGAMHSVIQAFMTWQNSGGDVTIRPTKSGQD